MGVWSTLFNFFGSLMLGFMMLVIYNDISINKKQFEELRLKYVVDYATEGAFMQALLGDNLGISYKDLESVNLTPTNTLETFKSIFLMSYDMSISDENMKMLDNYIKVAVLVNNDGFYVADLVEVDTPSLVEKGGEYELRWGLKRPFAIGYPSSSPTKYVAYNLSTEFWSMAKKNGSDIEIKYGKDFADLAVEGVFVDRETINKEVSRLVTNAINASIARRNVLYNKLDNKFIYIPSSQTMQGVNSLSKPSLFISVGGIDFLKTDKLEASSVGGYTIYKKKRVLGFVKDGIKYYCYESQLPKAEFGLVDDFFNTVDEAAQKGYRPHIDYLLKKIQ